MNYEQHSNLQRHVGDNLFKIINDHINLSSTTVMDLGCGTGYISKLIKQRSNPELILGCDIAIEMCHYARKHSSVFCGDAESLALASNSLDCIVSNLALQWCLNLEKTFNELSRTLKSNGYLFATTFGCNTLHELKYCWQLVDQHHHVNSFENENEIHALLKKNQFMNIKITSETLTYLFLDFKSILYNQKNIGANIVIRNRNHLTGKNKFRKVQNHYRTLFRSPPYWRTSYEILYITAQKK